MLMLKWLWLFVCVAGTLGAGAKGVSLRVEPGDLGLGGAVRPGEWAGVLVTVENGTADDIDVRVRWLLRDEDGDEVVSERRATVNAQRSERVWVYGALPMSASGVSGAWELQVVGAEDGALLGSVLVRPESGRVVELERELIGVMSVADLGLGDYERGDTQHAGVQLVRGLTLAGLPDRWYGLSGVSTLIWTDDTQSDPVDPSIPPAVWPALREWVVRGGHLVIVLPTVGQTWTQSPIADLLPVGGAGLRSTQAELLPHPRLSAFGPEELTRFPMYVFDEPGARSGASVLLRNRAEEPIALSVRRGFGLVTMIGVDLTSPAVRAAGVPSGTRRLWNDVLGWTAPVLTQQQVTAMTTREENKQPTLREAHRMRPVSLTSAFTSAVSMQGAVAVVLLGAVLLFALYLLVSAGSYALVRAKGKVQHAWLAFVAVSAAFSVVAWAGAWAARPGTLSASHVSVIDYDGNSPLIRVQSWLSLMVPQFGRANVALPNDAAVARAFEGRSPSIGAVEAHDTLASPGLVAALTDAGFLDPQRYTLDAERPDTLDIPLRATTKNFRAQRLATADTAPGRFTQQAPVRLADDFSGPTGSITHDFPAPLRNVLIIYAPGEQYRGAQRELATPMIWRYQQPANPTANADWQPNQPLDLNGVPPHALELVRRPQTYTTPRGWAREGWLGPLVEKLPADTSVLDVQALPQDPVRDMLMLSFYGLLPPPEFTQVDTFPGASRATRPGATALDLSPLLSSPRLIILALMPNSELPVPLTVDGQTPQSQGLTMIRAVWDLPVETK